MNKDEAILRYKTAMAVFKKWHTEGSITDADLLALSTKLARKYGLSSYSIYLENDLLYNENRVIYSNRYEERRPL